MRLTTELGEDGQGLVCVAGNSTLPPREPWQRAPSRSWSTPDGRRLTLDLAVVTFMDCRGIAALVRIRVRLLAAGPTLTVRHLFPRCSAS